MAEIEVSELKTKLNQILLGAVYDFILKEGQTKQEQLDWINETYGSLWEPNYMLIEILYVPDTKTINLVLMPAQVLEVILITYMVKPKD
jgi:cytochrome c-type biogenesis protein CcmH/NrfF